MKVHVDLHSSRGDINLFTEADLEFDKSVTLSTRTPRNQ